MKDGKMKDGGSWLGCRHSGNGGPRSPELSSGERDGAGLETDKPAGYEPRKSYSRSFLFISILLVGIHSMILGMFIYFYTDTFYKIFFSTRPENVFFVKQSGIFLFCLGAYYLLPFVDFQKFYSTVLFTIFTKIVAVLFLVFNAYLSLSPTAIYMAAVGDASMALLLLTALYFYRRNTQGGTMASLKT